MDQSEEKRAYAARPPASAWLNIDSEDRYTSIDEKFLTPIPANNFRIQKKQPLLYGAFKRVGVSQIQLQYRLPTVFTDTNDTFVLKDDTNNVYYVLQIGAGYYSGPSLAAAIEAEVLDISGNPFTDFTCEYDDNVGGLVWTNTGVNMRIQPFDPNTPSLEQNRIFFRTFETFGGTGPQAAALRFTLGTPKLIFTRYIDIVSDRLAKFQRVKDADTLLSNKTNIVARVYLTAPNTRVDPGAYGGPFDLTWDPNTPKHSMWSTDEAIYELDFRMYDERGNLLPWSTRFNTEFQMSILASET